MAEDDRDELLTLAEAGKRLGRHPEALRALVRRHRLPAQRDNLGRLLLRLTDLSTPEHARPAHPAAPEHARPVQPVEAGLAEAVAELRDALAEERVARARAEGELQMALRWNDALTEAVAAARAEAAELRGELAEARRPWLLRLLEALRRR